MEEVVDDYQDLTFGAALRTYREKAGYTQEHLGRLVGVSAAHIGHVERGIRTAKEDYAESCERALGLPRGELTKHLPKGAQWLSPWLEYERKATQLLTYQLIVIPGLLQRKDYARALFVGQVGWTEERVDDALKTRMARQAILARRKDPPFLWVVIDESALRRPIGGIATMKDQLEYLIKATRMPHITIQILPYAAMSTAGIDGGYVIAQLPGKPDCVYAESATHGEIRTRYTDVQAIHLRHRALTSQALSPDDSSRFIQSILEEQ